jgi:predicted DNA-binding transcriptional regulator YafY
MEEERDSPATRDEASLGRHGKLREKDPSTGKPLRIMLLAVLLHLSWPHYLTKQQIIQLIPLYGENPDKAFYRDLTTLTDCNVKDLPAPDDEGLASWCEQQQRLRRLAIVHDSQKGAFKLVQSMFSLDITEDEARAFVALQGSFVPGTPYASAVQMLLQRWEWLLSEQGKQLVTSKRKRKGRPVVLPLSPVSDYSQHVQVILQLDEALENGVYVSFAYIPLSQSWDDPPEQYRHVEPYELEYREGHWYFCAYIESMSCFLDYRVDRIRPDSLSLDQDRYRPGMRTRPGVKIRYWVAPEMARHGTLSVRLREQKVTLPEDGQGAYVEGYARSIWWAAKLLLGYGDQVKALAPAELVERMREKTRATARLYEMGE